MSAFVGSDRFKVDIKYQVIFDEDSVPTGIKIVSLDNEDKNTKHLVCLAVGSDFHATSRIMEQATVINDVTGQPMLMKSVFLKLIILNFFKEWNLADENGQSHPINKDNVQKLHYNIVVALSRKWLRKTSGKGPNI